MQFNPDWWHVIKVAKLTGWLACSPKCTQTQIFLFSYMDFTISHFSRTELPLKSKSWDNQVLLNERQLLLEGFVFMFQEVSQASKMNIQFGCYCCFGVNCLAGITCKMRTYEWWWIQIGQVFLIRAWLLVCVCVCVCVCVELTWLMAKG